MLRVLDKIKKTTGHSPLKGGVCDSPLFLECSEIDSKLSASP